MHYFKSFITITAIACASVITAFTIHQPKSKPAPEKGWEKLLDKNMSKWGTYLSYAHKKDYAGKPVTDESGQPVAPAGYNQPGQKVFTIEQQQGEPVLHVSGELYGCAFTKQEYENFHLKLKVKWGKNLYGPRVGKLKDSGILYFSQGEAGVDYWRSWMLSQEFQIMEGHMGDYWNIASSGTDIRAYLPEGKMNSIASATQPFLHFGNGQTEGMCLRSDNFETPGGWTTLELVCYQGKSLHIVNGHVVMVLQNSHYVDNAQSKPLTKGKIQLQSEGCEVYFKDVQIRNISALPVAYQAYYK